MVRRGDSVGKWDMNNLCGIRGLVGRGGVLLRRWGMELGREGRLGREVERFFEWWLKCGLG